jgi:putative ABC transport system permease protein
MLGRFSLREVRSRPTRASLTFLSITIGVGAVVAVLLSISTTRQAQKDILRAVSGKADLEVISDNDQGFSDKLLESILATPGVDVAVPSIARFATLFPSAKAKGIRVQVLGIDPAIDQRVRDYEVVDGTPLKQRQDLLLDASFANSLRIKVGDEIKLLARGGLRAFKVAGLVKPRGGTAVSLGSAVYMELKTAENALGSKGQIDQVQLVVKSDADVGAIKESLMVALPEGVTIQTPRSRSQMAEETMFATENGLRMAIAFAVLISTFIIYNTFQMAVGERRKQLGILRAIGATRWQVGWMILREALVISVVASAAGCALGIYGATLLTRVTEQMMQVTLPSVTLNWLPFVAAVGIGILVSIIGSILPARRASSVEPLEAMRAIESSHNQDVIAITQPLSGIVFLVGLVLLLLAVSGKLPLGGDVAAVIVLLLSMILFVPTLLGRVSAQLASWMRPWLGVEAELAQRQLTRHVGRSALTIGVMFIAISTSAGMAGNILDNVQNVRDWYTRAIIGDFFVRAGNPDLATGAAADMPADIAEQLKQVEGIESIDPIRYVSARSGDHTVLVIVRDFIGQPGDFFDLVEGELPAAIKGLKDGKVVVGSVLTQRLGLHPGDTIPLETQFGTKQLEIVATTNEYIAGGLTIYMQREVAEQLLNVAGVHAYVIQADDNRLSEVESQLQKICQDNHIILQSYADVVGFINGMVNSVIASLWMLLALGCVIAAMGLVNTLTMNILEQTREIGMLRVVAMTRSQVRRMVLAQAILLGTIGLLPGALAGIFISYVISLSSLSILGHNVIFQWRLGLVFGCLILGAVIVLLASLLPAERAARLKLAAALHYE